MAENRGQLAAHQAIDREGDLGAEKNCHVDAFLIHVLEPRRRVYHAGAIAPRLFSHGSTDTRPGPLGGRPKTSFQQDARIAFVVLQAHRRLRAPFLGHPACQIDIAFIHVAVSIDDEYVIEIFHQGSLQCSLGISVGV